MTDRTKGFDALIGLGSNLGNKSENLARAIELLTEQGDITLKATSQVYSTAPWGHVDQDSFANMCVAVSTELSPRDLLARCLAVEAEMKRVRLERWGPRIIDVDVLTYRDVTMNEPDLILPHPRITERAFVLVPLIDIAPDLEIEGHNLGYWLAKLDASDVVPFKKVDGKKVVH